MICLWFCGTELALHILKASLSRLASQFPLSSSPDQQAAVDRLLRMEVKLPAEYTAAEYTAAEYTETKQMISWSRTE